MWPNQDHAVIAKNILEDLDKNPDPSAEYITRAHAAATAYALTSIALFIKEIPFCKHGNPRPFCPNFHPEHE